MIAFMINIGVHKPIFFAYLSKIGLISETLCVHLILINPFNYTQIEVVSSDVRYPKLSKLVENSKFNETLANKISTGIHTTNHQMEMYPFFVNSYINK